MDLLKSLEVNFGKGLAVYAAIRFAAQKHSGRKLFLQLTAEEGPVLVSVGLDNEDQLNVWITDLWGKDYNVRLPPQRSLFDRDVLLVFDVRTFGPDTTVVRIGALPGAIHEQMLPCSLPPIARFEARIGANRDGKESGAFYLAELLTYAQVPERGAHLELLQYFNRKFKLDLHNPGA